jgi:hypothetical protein
MMKASLAQIEGIIEPEFRPEGYSCVLTFETVSPKHFGNVAALQTKIRS